MGTKQKDADINKVEEATDRKPSKLQALKSLNGLIAKAEEHGWTEENELELFKAVKNRWRNEVMGEL